jgi:flavin-binding protein dodecin
MPVARVTEVIGISPLGFKEAFDQALIRAGKTLRNITNIDIKKQSAVVSQNSIQEYRVTCNITFLLDD